MNKLIWTLQVVAGLAFAGAGAMKLTSAPAELRANPNMAWTNDFSDRAIKAIGAAEVVGAIGLVAPAATRIAPMLTPAAGVGLAALMGGAAYTHIRRQEPPVAPLMLGTLALAAGLLRARRLKG